VKTASCRVEEARAAGERLDVFLADSMGLFSRSQARTRVQEARVNGKTARLSRKLKLGDEVTVTYTDPPPVSAIPQDLPLDIVFENDDVIVVNKPQGMVVHPGSGNPTGTLVNALLFHCEEMGRNFIGESLRPGIVHRLDKDTSGVMIAAKNTRAHEYLAGQFAARKTRKRYIAILLGRPKVGHGSVETCIARDPVSRRKFVCADSGGKAALTFYTVVRVYTVLKGTASYAFASLRPKTGRTHQLRVHMRHISTPIMGDPLYGRNDLLFPDATLMLHAHRLAITLPGESEPRVFTAPLPRRFREVLRALQSLSLK
jgi:23S rRNA pseudouridine1911/1915/1917 synthase